MNEIYNEYINSIKKFTELFDETRQNVHRMGEIYVDSIKANQEMYNLYKENYDSSVKLNKQWSEIFLATFLGKLSQVKKKAQEEEQKQEGEQLNGKQQEKSLEKEARIE